MKKFSLDITFNYDLILRVLLFCLFVYFMYEATVLIKKSFTPDQAKSFGYLFFAYAIAYNVQK